MILITLISLNVSCECLLWLLSVSSSLHKALTKNCFTDGPLVSKLLCLIHYNFMLARDYNLPAFCSGMCRLDGAAIRRTYRPGASIVGLCLALDEESCSLSKMWSLMIIISHTLSRALQPISQTSSSVCWNEITEASFLVISNWRGVCVCLDTLFI